MSPRVSPMRNRAYTSHASHSVRGCPAKGGARTRWALCHQEVVLPDLISLSQEGWGRSHQAMDRLCIQEHFLCARPHAQHAGHTQAFPPLCSEDIYMRIYSRTEAPAGRLESSSALRIQGPAGLPYNRCLKNVLKR